MSSLTPVAHRFSVDDFHRMLEVGILRPDDAIELIDGELLHMAPMGSWHASTVTLLHETLLLGLNAQAIVSSQTPLVLGDYSEPEPDVLVLRQRADRYRDALPRAADVLLLIEVSDSTAQYDREVKGRLYAYSGIPELWVVERQERSVWVYRQPEGEGYAAIHRCESGNLSPLAFPGVMVDLAALF